LSPRHSTFDCDRAAFGPPFPFSPDVRSAGAFVCPLQLVTLKSPDEEVAQTSSLYKRPVLSFRSRWSRKSASGLNRSLKLVRRPACGRAAGRVQAVSVDERLDIALSDGRIVRLGGIILQLSNNLLVICPTPSGNVLCYVQIVWAIRRVRAILAAWKLLRCFRPVGRLKVHPPIARRSLADVTVVLRRSAIGARR
jgi:hypothetical protein